MHPVIFTLPFIQFPIHSYGLMLAISFILGILLSSWLAKKNGLNPDVIADAGFWIIIAAIVGSRLYYVFLHFNEFSANLTTIFWPAKGEQCGIGGLVMFGGVIGAIVAATLWFKLKKITFLPYADVLAPGLGLGIFLTRIGCFLNGCCYGAPTTGAFGITFPVMSPAGHYQHAMHATALLPSQLFDSFGGLVIAIVALIVVQRKTFPGFAFFLVAMLYSVQRFLVDMTRFYGDNERLGPLSHNQVVCIILFIIFGGLILKNLLFKAEESAAPEATVDPEKPS
jgi:phosphatidylglycerol:prolipoprotein diacylglycerol transferase